MQENTPAQGTPAQGEIKELKGVEIEIPPKMIRLNRDMWGTYKYFEKFARAGDFLLVLGALRLDNDNDTFAIIVKVINMDKVVNTDNGKE